jgi:hypothetical protein
MRLQFMEQIYSTNIGESYSTSRNANVEHMERRLSATRKRYLQAVESLARVRRLLSRAGVQINVAQNQVVANGVA